MPRRLELSLALVAVAVMAATLAAAAPTAASGPKTAASVYMPFAANGASRLTGPTKSGRCFAGSESTPRRDAWRCMSGNSILDPCFSSAKAPSFVLCPAAPWSNSGARLKLKRALPRSLGNHGALSLSNQPWALELSSGRRCLFAGGATALAEGRRLNYFCTTGGSDGLWGFPDRRSQPWSILSGPASAKHLSQRLPIRRAWM